MALGIIIRFSRFGVPLIDGGTVRLPAIVGEGYALDLAMTGRVIDSETAERIGLITRVHENGTTISEAVKLANLMSKFPQGTGKRLFNC